jgi:L,D-peptidoglycan transpeptidase YkuD (ErfK/YbiS/YcfS/YnhG family)
MILHVSRMPGTPSTGILRAGPLRFRCALGRCGIKALKREGDGATPAGLLLLRRVLYRPDRLNRPRTALPVRALRPNDGWCDAPGDANYNRPVRSAYGASHERLWREDGLYDLIVVLGHNDVPRKARRGSAIFMHVARDGYAPTEGCIALARDDLLKLLPMCGPGSAVRVHL